jgi:hypothetical protein
MLSRLLVTLGTVVVMSASVSAIEAQEIVDEALQAFPAQTDHLEYSNLAKLRELPGYDALQQRYLGAPLRDLQGSLAKLGITDSDVDELVLGWDSLNGQGRGARSALYGLAFGRFPAEEIAKAAAVNSVKSTRIGHLKAYCVGRQNEICVAWIGDSLGAFGSPKVVLEIMAARSGTVQGLGSNPDFSTLVSAAKFEAPIWGVAEHSAMAGWLSAAMPGAEKVPFDWSQLFTGVTNLTYRIDVADKPHLEMQFQCESASAANTFEQLLASLRILQRMTWQTRNPGLSNPFKGMELQSSGDRVELRLDVPVSAN